MILEQSLFFIDTADVSCARIVMRIPSVENRFPYNFRAVRHKACFITKPKFRFSSTTRDCTREREGVPWLRVGRSSTSCRDSLTLVERKRSLLYYGVYAHGVRLSFSIVLLPHPYLYRNTP